MSNVFVSGATGFVGAYLAQELLKAGYRVFALRRPNSPMDLVKGFADQIQWIEGDLMDLPSLDEALHGIDYVYHAAALISFDPKQAALMQRINVEGTANLLDAALAQGVKKFLHVSSIAALGRKEHQTHIDENSIWENNAENSRYAQSKFQAECLVWQAREAGLPIVIVNPGLIFGAGFWHKGTGQMVHRLASGLSYYPKGSSCLVDVRDLAKVSRLLMETDLEGQRYIICAENRSFQDIFATLALTLNKPAPPRPLPAWLGQVACRLDWLRSKIQGRPPIITSETLRNAQHRYHYHNEKIKQTLSNFQFRPAEQTLQQTALAYQQARQNQESASFWLDSTI